MRGGSHDQVCPTTTGRSVCRPRYRLLSGTVLPQCQHRGPNYYDLPSQQFISLNAISFRYLQGKHFSIKEKKKDVIQLNKKRYLMKNKIHVDRLLSRTEIYGLLMYHISLINGAQTKLNHVWNESESRYKLKLIKSLYIGILSEKSCFQNGCFSNKSRDLEGGRCTYYSIISHVQGRWPLQEQ